MKPSLQIRNRTILLADLVLIVTAVLASFALRLDLGPTFAFYLPGAWIMVAVALVVKPIVYYLFGCTVATGCMRASGIFGSLQLQS